ncbi:MAG: hypothetical protein JW957_08785 [Candidatus Omnitrophica bacterium]|nr:hypothetical protein [Candidatus Omnitrophota bacterium]
MVKKTDSLVKIMGEKEIEKEFLGGLEFITHDLFAILEELLKMKTFPNRELIFAVMREVDEIETFLDDYGASHNKKFFYFRELIGSIRWINIVIFQGLHLLVRIDSYHIEIAPGEKEDFKKRLKKTITFYLYELKNLAVELKGEAEKYGFKKNRAKFGEQTTLVQMQKKILPPDLNENIIKEKDERVFEVLVKFLENSEAFNIFVCSVNAEEEITEAVTEEVLEKYRSIFNQLESLYDTYLKNTEIEKNLYDLRKIRSYIAITLHLLEIGKALVHFYERHSDKVSRYSTAVQISSLVNKRKIKETLRNLVLEYSITFLLKGKDISVKIFGKMGRDADEFIYATKKMIIPSHRLEDFHLRPIMPVTQIAGKYEIDTHLYYNRNKYNLKSPIEMAIAIPDIREVLAKENVDIMIQGPRKSVAELCEFLKERCGAYEKAIVCNLISSEIRL